MRPRPLTVVALLLAVAFAGCTAEDTDDEAPGATPGPSASPSPTGDRSAAERQEAGRYVPWTLSDHWTYDMQVRGAAGTQKARLVYYQELGPEYVVGTPTYEEALHHAVFSVNPILGRIHKGHLAPHESGEHATMFPFEDETIQDGKKWVTVFYGRQLSLTATFDPAIPTPEGTAPGHRITGSDADGTFHIAYDYVPRVKWFTHLTATDAEGTVIDLRLTAQGTGYSGPAHFIRAKTLFDEAIETNVVPETRTFTVDEDLVARDRVEGFAIHANVQTDGVVAQIVLKDPEGTEIWRKTHEDAAGIDEVWPEGERPTGAIGERPQWPAGTYTFEFLSVGNGTATVTLAATQDNSGSI